MVFAISEEVQHKEEGQTMVVTGYASGMVASSLIAKTMMRSFY